MMPVSLRKWTQERGWIGGKRRCVDATIAAPSSLGPSYICGATDVKCNLDIAALDCETGAWNVDRLCLGDTLEDSRIVAYGKRPVAEPLPKLKYRLATFKIGWYLASGDCLSQSLLKGRTKNSFRETRFNILNLNIASWLSRQWI